MRRREWNRQWRRHDDSLEVMLGLVGYDPDAAWLGNLTDQEARDAEWWAGMLHLRASDNPVRRYPRPEFLPEPWEGEPTEAGNLWGNPTPLRGPA